MPPKGKKRAPTKRPAKPKPAPPPPPNSDVCGELSVWAVLHGMPAKPSGEIRMAWTHIVHVMKAAGCKIGDRVVRALVRLKK